MPDVIIIKTRTFGTRIYWPLLYIETGLKGTAAQFGLFYGKSRRRGRRRREGGAK